MKRDQILTLACDLRTIAVLAAIFAVMLLAAGCAAAVPLDAPAEIQPGERMDVTTDDAWRTPGPSLQTFDDPFAGENNIDLRKIPAPTFEPMEPIR